jgi:hypothetical protein
MILQTGPKNQGLTPDDLGVATAVGTLQLPAGLSPAQALVDGWGQPVAFTRTYDNQPFAIALLSAGKDGKFGVYDATLTANAPKNPPVILVGNPALPVGNPLNPATLGPLVNGSTDPVDPTANMDPPSGTTRDNILGYTP